MHTESDLRIPTGDCSLSPHAENLDGTVEDLLDAALAEQRRDWITGKRTPAAERLRRSPALALDPAQAAELVYHEFTLRQELGESPDWGEYLRQFPEHAAMLRLLHQADQIVERALAPAQPAPRPAAQFSDFELLEEIGHGGMGVVYRARQRSLDRIVAVKLMRTDDPGEEERRRFAREAKAVARLQHPNIVQIYEVGEAGGRPFLSLEFVEGESLARRLNGTPLAARQGASLVGVLARAMHYAHGKGIIHRDLKPSNVLLAGTPQTTLELCTAKVTDFGLAKRLDGGGDTGSSTVLGTPSYMAPEQAEAKTAAIDRRTDVYGLGALLYELLTGRPPFRAESPLQTLQQVVQADPARPRLLNPAVPRDLETVCLQCLQKEPRLRYPSALALAEDLDRFLHGQPVRARPVGPVGRAARWCRRKPVVAAMAGMLILAVAGGFLTSLLLWQRAVSGEVEALANLRRVEAARQETEDFDVGICTLLERSLQPSLSHLSLAEPTATYQASLNDAKDCLGYLSERNRTNHVLAALKGCVYLQLGVFELLRHHDAAQPLLEQATSFWRELLAEHPGKHGAHMWYAISCFLLEQVYDRQGNANAAQKTFDEGFRVWQALTREPPRGRDWLPLVKADLEMGRLLVKGSSAGKDVAERLRTIRQRCRRAAGPAEGEAFFDLVQVGYLHGEAQEQEPMAPPVPSLADCREAASIVSRLLSRTDLEENLRVHVACISVLVSMDLRRRQAPEEALRLSRQANRTLQELLAGSADKASILDALNESWFEMSKVRWKLGQAEETLTACRNALKAARDAFLLDPAVPGREEAVGDRYLRLGRKLCELGRPDEAEACFRERQALWPGDGNKHAEVLRELRKWADQAGPEGKALSPERQQERQRYLDLYARLELKGIAGQGERIKLHLNY